MIPTGKTPVNALTFWAIMSLSLVVNLPGLAVTPMLGNLEKIFPHTTQIEEQLLTVLPNLLIIPFVLLSGKLSMSRHKIAIVVLALSIYTLCAVLYLFASSMAALIVISCLLGCGAGLLIPFSTGLIADTFTGRYRMKEMGLQSGLSNMTLVAATFIVGWLSHSDWHTPFLVYLAALIPLALSFGLRGIPKADLYISGGPGAARITDEARAEANEKSPKVVRGFYIGRILSVMAVYFFISFATMTISYYCPFLIEKKDWSSTLSGTVTSLYFLFIFLPGFLLVPIVRVTKGLTFFWGAVTMTIGIGMFSVLPQEWAMCVGACLAGLGYGICQPLIYNKASRTVTSDAKATMSLAFVLSANYLSIVLTPFIIDLFRGIFHSKPDGTFAFTLSAIMLAAYSVIAFFGRRSFSLGVTKDYYSK